jgi:hypothetical protein
MSKVSEPNATLRISSKDLANLSQPELMLDWRAEERRFMRNIRDQAIGLSAFKEMLLPNQFESIASAVNSLADAQAATHIYDFSVTKLLGRDASMASAVKSLADAQAALNGAIGLAGVKETHGITDPVFARRISGLVDIQAALTGAIGLSGVEETIAKLKSTLGLADVKQAFGMVDQVFAR